MSDFAIKLLPMVKKTLRQADNEFDDEIGSYIDTVATDLQDAGIHYSFFSSTKPGWALDGQILQACRWYALSVFGLYNPDMEKYALAYASLKATLATQKRYTIKGQYPTGYEEGYAQGDLDGQEKGKAEGERIGYADALSKRTDLVATANGEYTPTDDSTGFKSVSVNVANKLGKLAEGSLTEITEEDLQGITTIKLYAFYELYTLQKVNIPSSVKTIENKAFSGCTALSSVTLSEGVTSFGQYAFDQTPIADIVIPASLSVIGISAFMYCRNLESINFAYGSQLEKIEFRAFMGCSKLKKIRMSSTTPPTLGSNVFDQCPALTEIMVPRGCAEAYKAATNWSAKADIIIEGDV